tara:strand:+ start:850 stop:1251 length:402 start_codon:yes stop_codon:yes gene_type:complete
MTPAIADIFARYPDTTREALLQLRRLILETAAQLPGVGALEETLKWGQVSYLTSQSGSGTTIRIDHDRPSGRAALYVNCKTDLVSRYRTLYPDRFSYQGDRAVVLPPDAEQDALRHMVALALTYHAAKKTGGT